MNPQPPAVNYYTNSRNFWTDLHCEYLIDQRMSRNDEFWSLASWDRGGFWQSVAQNINECFGTRYSEYQVKSKWKNLLNEYLVSIIYFILIVVLLCVYIYINGLIFLG